MSSDKPITPRKGQKPSQPSRPGRPGRPKKDQHITVRSEVRTEPDYRLLARAVIRMVLDEQRRSEGTEPATGSEMEDDNDAS